MDTKRKLWVIALLIEGALILLFGIIAYQDLMPDDKHNVIWSFFVGISFIALALLSYRSNSTSAWLDLKLQKMGAWFDVSTLQIFLFGTSLIFTVMTINAAGLWIRMYSPVVAVTSWLIGIGISSFGAWRYAENFPTISRQTLFWLVIVIIFAFLFRGFSIGKIPVLLNGDEASAGVSAIDFATGKLNNIFISSWFSFPSLFPAIQSIGVSLWGNNVEVLRIPSAIIGALTVGLVYLTGKTMFDPRAGFFAAITLAALHLHIHFSRLGLNNIWDGFWFTLTLGSIWHGWKTNQRWSYILAGLSLGFSQYFYTTSKVLPLILLVLAALAFYFQRKQFLKNLPDFVVTFIVALSVVMPLLWHYVKDPSALLASFARVSIVEETLSSSLSLKSFLLYQLPTALGAYTFKESFAYYLPGVPILLPVAAVFFYAGLIFLIFKDRDSRFTILTLWLLTFSLIGSLSSDVPAAQRYVAAAPACALLVGYGLDKTTQTLTQLVPKSSRIFGTLSYILLAIIVVNNLFFYFFEYTSFTEMDEAVSTGMIGYQFGIYLKDQPPDTQFVVFGTPRLSYDTPAVLYLAPQIHGINAPEDWATFDENQLTAHKIVFVFLPEYQHKIEFIRKQYPEGILLTFHSPGGVLFWLYELTMD